VTETDLINGLGSKAAEDLFGELPAKWASVAAAPSIVVHADAAEAQAVIDLQSARIAALEAENNQLKAENDAMRQSIPPLVAENEKLREVLIDLCLAYDAAKEVLK
jgi:transcriptional regulator with AAA-type ATPase domain